MLKRPIFLATCMYGITFIILENTAGTSVSFATNILDACHITQTPGRGIGIPLAVNTFCCVLHTLSRKWGILLNNFFRTLKLCLLIFIIIIEIVCKLLGNHILLFRAFKNVLTSRFPIGINHDIASIKFDPKTSFNSTQAPGYPINTPKHSSMSYSHSELSTKSTMYVHFNTKLRRHFSTHILIMLARWPPKFVTHVKYSLGRLFLESLQ